MNIMYQKKKKKKKKTIVIRPGIKFDHFITFVSFTKFLKLTRNSVFLLSFNSFS